MQTTIPFAGLDAAGKTTILYKLKLGDVVTTIPTIGKMSCTHAHYRMSLFTIDGVECVYVCK